MPGQSGSRSRSRRRRFVRNRATLEVVLRVVGEALLITSSFVGAPATCARVDLVRERREEEDWMADMILSESSSSD